MITPTTSYLSLLHKIFNKFFYLIITIYFLTQSVSDYALLILYFLLSSYIYEIYSLSIPKAFSIFYYKFKRDVYLSTISFTAYLTLFLFICSCILFYFIKNFFDVNSEFSNYFFLLAVCIRGLSIALDDIIDKFCFLELKHNNLYFFDFFKLTIILIFVIFYFYFFTNLNIFNFLIIYSSLMILFSLFKYFIFLGKLNLNILINLNNLKKIEFKGIPIIMFSIFLTSILILTQLTFSRILIVNFKGLDFFANFSFHYQLVEISSLFFLAIIQIIVPVIIHSVKKGHEKKIIIFQEKILIIYLLFPPIIFLVINFIAKNLILLFTSQIIYDPILMFFLSLNLFSFSLFMTFYQYLLIKKKEIFFIKTLLVGLILNLILSIILIKYFSLTGVAIANFLSNYVIFIILNKKLNFFYFRKKTYKYLLFYSTRLILIFFVLFLFPIPDFYPSTFMNLMKDLIYCSILIFISEIFMPRQYRILKNYNDFMQLVKFNLKKRNF